MEKCALGMKEEDICEDNVNIYFEKKSTTWHLIQWINSNVAQTSVKCSMIPANLPVFSPSQINIGKTRIF